MKGIGWKKINPDNDIAGQIGGRNYKSNYCMTFSKPLAVSRDYGNSFEAMGFQ